MKRVSAKWCLRGMLNVHPIHKKKWLSSLAFDLVMDSMYKNTSEQSQETTTLMEKSASPASRITTRGSKLTTT
jgi:hypothetical protein